MSMITRQMKNNLSRIHLSTRDYCLNEPDITFNEDDIYIVWEKEGIHVTLFDDNISIELQQKDISEVFINVRDAINFIIKELDSI